MKPQKESGNVHGDKFDNDSRTLSYGWIYNGKWEEDFYNIVRRLLKKEFDKQKAEEQHKLDLLSDY